MTSTYKLFPSEESPMQLHQDEVIDLLDHVKAPERHEAMLAANIDIFEIPYEA